MRAMPSPTDSTVPTSETSASASKFAIWSRMTREISAARMSIVQLAFHRGCETVEFGADRRIDLLAAQLDDDAAKNCRVDRGVEGDVAAGTSAKLLLQLRQLVVVERAGGDDLCRGFAAVLGGEPTEGPDDRTELTLAAVAGEDAHEIAGDGIEAELWGQRGQCLTRPSARNQRACDQLTEILRVSHGLVEGVEALADAVDLPLVAGEVEQGRGVTPC